MTDDLARWVEGLVEGRRGTLVQQKRERWVWKVEEHGRVWFAKRGIGSRRAEIRREAECARLLHAENAGPEVLASGRAAGAEWLVTASAGELDLANVFDLLSIVAVDPPQMRACELREVAHTLRRLHESGMAFPDLNAHHVFNSAQGRTRLIDSGRMEQFSGPAPKRLRARDLAALIFSIATTSWDPSLRADSVRFLSEATGTRGDALREFCRAVRAELSSLAARTRWRHGVLVGDDRVIFLESVARDPAAIDDLWAAAFAREVMTVVRTLPDRENRTLGTGPDGKPLFFVKVFPPTKKGWSPAMREIAAIDLFQRKGILVNRVAAYAEDVDKGSLIAVKTAAGEPLDDLLRRGVSVAERRALAVQTARIWRRMRECGLRHRDAYPCHLFAAPWPGRPLRFELRLIDLTRAGEAPFPKERWFVKDAAALWHGLPKPPVTRTDAVRWLREYFRTPKLTREAKRFARKVAAKERRIAAHSARRTARKRPPRRGDRGPQAEVRPAPETPT